MVIIDFAAAGNYLAVRPSGTEPKVKFYLFAYTPPAQCANLAGVKALQVDRLSQLGKDVQEYVRSVLCV